MVQKVQKNHVRLSVFSFLIPFESKNHLRHGRNSSNLQPKGLETPSTYRPDGRLFPAEFQFLALGDGTDMNHRQNHMYKWNQIQALVWLIWRQMTLGSTQALGTLKISKKYQELPTIHSTGFYPFKICLMFKHVQTSSLESLKCETAALSYADWVKQLLCSHSAKSTDCTSCAWANLGDSLYSALGTWGWASALSNPSHYFLGRPRLTTSYNFNPEESQRRHIRTMSRCNLRRIQEAGTAPEIQWDLQVALCRPSARTKKNEPSKLPLSTTLRTLQKVFTRKNGVHGLRYTTARPNPSKSTDGSSYVRSQKKIISYDPLQ